MTQKLSKCKIYTSCNFDCEVSLILNIPAALWGIKLSSSGNFLKKTKPAVFFVHDCFFGLESVSVHQVFVYRASAGCGKRDLLYQQRTNSGSTKVDLEDLEMLKVQQDETYKFDFKDPLRQTVFVLPDS